MRSLFVRWSVAVVVGTLWGAVMPPARPRAEGASYQPRGAGEQRVIADPTGR
jgi:hypothetical protein